LLSEANYKGFWQTLESDDLYADLTADIVGFEELMRIRICVTVGNSCREVDRGVMEGWLQLRGSEFERFLTEICTWGIDNSTGGKGVIRIPTNKDNEAKGTVVRENVQFDRTCPNVRDIFPFIWLLTVFRVRKDHPPGL